MTGFGVAGTTVMMDEVNISETDTEYSPWIYVQPGFSFTNWIRAVSDTSAPELTFEIHISPLGTVIAQDEVDLTKYVVISLATGITTEDTLLRYVSTSLDSPFIQCRHAVTGTGSNDADTVVSTYLTQFN